MMPQEMHGINPLLQPTQTFSEKTIRERSNQGRHLTKSHSTKPEENKSMQPGTHKETADVPHSVGMSCACSIELSSSCTPRGLRRQHQILLVVSPLQHFSTEGNFLLAKIVAHAAKPCMKRCVNRCQNQRFAEAAIAAILQILRVFDQFLQFATQTAVEMVVN